jgi:hypothetical protein
VRVWQLCLLCVNGWTSISWVSDLILPRSYILNVFSSSPVMLPVRNPKDIELHFLFLFFWSTTKAPRSLEYRDGRDFYQYFTYWNYPMLPCSRIRRPQSFLAIATSFYRTWYWGSALSVAWWNSCLNANLGSLNALPSMSVIVVHCRLQPMI